MAPGGGCGATRLEHAKRRPNHKSNTARLNRAPLIRRSNFGDALAQYTVTEPNPVRRPEGAPTAGSLLKATQRHLDPRQVLFEAHQVHVERIA